MNKLLTILIVVFANCLVVQACSCIKYDKIDLQQFMNYNSIFEAKFISVNKREVDSDFNTSYNFYQKEIVVSITKIYKGDINENTITIYTPLDGGACGLPFKPNEKWVIYANSEYDELHANLCSRSFLKGKKRGTTTKWRKDKCFIKKYVDYTGLVEDDSAKGELLNGLPIGEWAFYNLRDGKLSKKAFYNEQHLLHGEMQYFDQDGFVFARSVYDNGVLVTAVHNSKVF